MKRSMQFFSATCPAHAILLNWFIPDLSNKEYNSWSFPLCEAPVQQVPRLFPEQYEGWSMVMPTHPYLAPRLSIQRIIPGPSHCTCLACNRMAPIMCFSPTTYYFPVRFKYLPQHSVVLHLCSLTNEREQVSHPYKKQAILYFFYINFRHLTGRQNTLNKMVETFPKFNLFLFP
jgi:hypothetical protein